MSIQSKFISFHKKIHLSRESEDYEYAREKDDSITDEIKGKFREEGYPVIESFIQGSLATYTAIIEKGKDFDIDRAIVIDTEDSPENPIIPKNIVLELLESRGFKNAKIKKPCVTADYSFEDLHIDIPIYRLSNGNYQLAVGKKNSSEENREWSNSAPKDLIDWVNDSSNYGLYGDLKLRQFRRLVQYLKRWRNETFSDDVSRKLFSIGITIMIKQHFQHDVDNDGCSSDVDALEKTIKNILYYGNYFINYGNEQYKVSVNLPVTPFREIFNSSLNVGTQFKNKLESLHTTLENVISETDEAKQCDMLRGVFGEDFPQGKSSNSISENTNKLVYSSAGIVGTSQGA